MKRTCSSLKVGETVTFLLREDGEVQTMTGYVGYVSTKQSHVVVGYLDGYQDMSTTVKFEDMLSVRDEDGRFQPLVAEQRTTQQK